MAEQNRSRIKDETLYQTLREEQGYSAEKSARIANAANKEGRKFQGKKGGASPNYHEWTVGELKSRAKELDLSGYSDLNKDQLIDKLRNH